MKSNSKIIENSSILWWIFGGCSLVTLYFNSKIQDPFNSPKMWILLIISSWLLGHLVFNNKGNFKDKDFQKFALLALLFSIFLLVSALRTDVLYTAFLGENQRRNGFLAYIALIILMLSAATFIKFQSLKRFNSIAFLTGMILAVYGLMQISGIDFIKWNNPYNAIISTVGNPNFAAAVMAMMAAIIFGPVLNSNFNKYYRLASLGLTLVLLYTIFLSDARQGLIAFAIGIGAYILIWLYTIKNKFRNLFLGGSIIIGIFSILGMLQIGPLTSLLYKSSVTVRGYYWRAGIEMFINHPWFGVGIDRYGAYFKEYREFTYPLNYGFTITSTNAHNLPIQIFATAGIFTGIFYILLLGFIAYRGILGIRNKTGNQKLQLASIFSAWLAYQAQSIISIDNIGISVWGWVLGGAVVGLSRENSSDSAQTIKSEKSKIRTPQFNFKQTATSSMSLILVLILIIPLYRSEKNMFETRMRFNPDVAENRSPLHEYAVKILSSNLSEPSYKITAASYLVASGFLDEGLKALDEIAKSDARNLDSLSFLAQFNEQLNKPVNAINYRLEIAKYDPWNALNYLQLGRNYKALEDFENMKKMREKINSFASKTQEAAQANSELI